MSVLEIVISIVIITLLAAIFSYFNSFLGIVFPGFFVLIIDIVIAILVIKFIIGRNHG